MMSAMLQLVLLACVAPFLSANHENMNHLMITPQSPVLEIGTNFTATCMIINTAEVTADDLYWTVSKTTIPSEKYTKINETALSVTIPVTDEKPEWLYCRSRITSAYTQLNPGKFLHAIISEKGYPPEKPENLSCIAVQDKKVISRNISCSWEPGRDSRLTTTYTLHVKVITPQTFNTSTYKNSAQVTLEIFPDHMTLEIWVEAKNGLGKVESEHLREDAGWFVKTNPPSDVKVISEKSFPTSLLINWTQPIAKEHMKLTYEIRFCPNGSQSWTYVPLVDTAKDIQSFRLQKLRPDTVYVTQVRCKNAREGHGYWSDWSTNATKRTPEDRPTSKPDLWLLNNTSEGVNGRHVTLIAKDPESANGKITRFDMKIKHGSRDWKSVQVNMSEADRSSSQRNITVLQLDDSGSIKVRITAINSVGKSPEAVLGIHDKVHELTPVEGLKVEPCGAQLCLEWKPPNSATEYVVEWRAYGDQMDWQRENRSTRNTAIKGNLEKFVCYKVSVYAIYSGWIGKPAIVEAFLEQGAPLEGPSVRLNGTPGRNEAVLVWEEIPKNKQQGFITNYTICYTDGIKRYDIVVPGNTTSYTLTSLSRNTKYDVWIKASTIGGSTNGFNHSFTTLKYGPGEIEAIVVGVSLGFLFIVLMTMLLCFYKKDVLKENCWPQIPNPGESTIGNWSPDYPLKAETPKENCLSGISVLDMDVCDGKSVFEEDKTSLPLKKDKYLSEEHSSGIGGSSCMSSPRQSVSDSDEGGDIADTTANTVQYSSVVASNAYKGQNPNSQSQQAIFSRSESTQPLLDSEENPDMLMQEGSRQSQRFPRQSCFTHSARNQDSTNHADFNQLEMEQQEVLEPLDFCPLEEDFEQITPTDGQSARGSSYMPQLGGYRPQ
ncbi:interleukin-6 receptor subunit beta isoform X2 [Scomber japonicus]|uniref:interleukin-6 receptor subunit beta isoform X2 n=1 Tax=Scomber japonicus TaxID=13676 RepID=UPI002306B595|nr:interleukin-6 receptor subunit beta isoform X2 [Scomber japonicus]